MMSIIKSMLHQRSRVGVGVMLIFIDKRRFFGKKWGTELPPGVAPKASGTVKGKWVWYRERDEGADTIASERARDKHHFDMATQSDKKRYLYLLKTGDIKLNLKEDYAINNVRNRVEVLNALLLNYFLGENAAVKNTIAYSTYYNEKNSYATKYYLDENGYVKEELASLYAGEFDSGIASCIDYNKAVIKEREYMPLRERLVVFGLMGFHDCLGNYDNFAFIKGNLIITDTGVGSGNTGQHATYVRAGSDTFDADPIGDLERLFNNTSDNVTQLRKHVRVKDIYLGIKKLDDINIEQLEMLFDEAFKPIPNPFDNADQRQNKFKIYNRALQTHKEKLLLSYKSRIDTLHKFNMILEKFYPEAEMSFHMPSFLDITSIDKKITQQSIDPKYYRIFSQVHEKWALIAYKDKPGKLDDALIAVYKYILDAYRETPINPQKIEDALVQADYKEVQVEFIMYTNDISTFLPAKWQFIYQQLPDEKKDSKLTRDALLQLKMDIQYITQKLATGSCSLVEAKVLLTEVVEKSIIALVSNDGKTILAKSYLFKHLGANSNPIAKGLENFLIQKKLVSRENLRKGETIDLPMHDEGTYKPSDFS